MMAPRIILGLIVGGMLVVGCKKEPVATPPSAGQTAAPAAPAASTPATMPPVVLHTQTPVPGQNPTTLPSLPEPAPAAGTSADARNLLSDVSANVAAKKWDTAADDLKKLNAMKGQLSPELKDQITTAQDKFVAAKTSSALNLPGIGAPPTTAPAAPNK